MASGCTEWCINMEPRTIWCLVLTMCLLCVAVWVAPDSQVYIMVDFPEMLAKMEVSTNRILGGNSVT